MNARAPWLAAALAVLAAACSMPDEPPPTTRLVYLDDGWSPSERNIYYYTPQGTELHGLRYEWFRYLELAGSRQLLADPRILSRFGFLYAPEQFNPGYQPPSFNPGNMSNRRTRGGPLMATNPGFEVFTYYDTDGKSKFFWFVSTGVYAQPDEKSNVFWFEPGFELKPVSNVLLRIEPGYQRVAENAQYITVIDDPAATETYGRRYVFARLDQRTFSAGKATGTSRRPASAPSFLPGSATAAARS